MHRGSRPPIVRQRAHSHVAQHGRRWPRGRSRKRGAHRGGRGAGCRLCVGRGASRRCRRWTSWCRSGVHDGIPAANRSPLRPADGSQSSRSGRTGAPRPDRGDRRDRARCLGVWLDGRFDRLRGRRRIEGRGLDALWGRSRRELSRRRDSRNRRRGDGGGLRLLADRRSRREQRQRVDVPIGIRRDANAKVDVRLGRRRVGARPDRPDRVALGDHPALVDERRAELRQRDRIAVRRPDRDHPPVAGHRARERHDAAGRRPHRRAHVAADVDAAMLPGRVGIRPEGEGSQERSVQRPSPG
jgi:hypothetical protein